MKQKKIAESAQLFSIIQASSKLKQIEQRRKDLIRQSVRKGGTKSKKGGCLSSLPYASANTYSCTEKKETTQTGTEKPVSQFETNGLPAMNESINETNLDKYMAEWEANSEGNDQRCSPKKGEIKFEFEEFDLRIKNAPITEAFPEPPRVEEALEEKLASELPVCDKPSRNGPSNTLNVEQFLSIQSFKQNVSCCDLAH